MIFKSISTEESLELGRALGRMLVPGDVACFDGELGTGKTVLIRAAAEGLGGAGVVTSPTFTIMHIYPEIRLCHVDAFRLEAPDQLIGAGIDDYLDGSWICAVEWAEKVRDALPENAVTIKLTFGREENDRLIEINGPEGWGDKLACLEKGSGRDAT